MEILNRWAVFAVLASVTAVHSQVRAAVILVDNFESYTAGSSINGQGAWEAQASRTNGTFLTTPRADNGNSNVVLRDGDKALRMVNRDAAIPDDFITVYTSMALPSTITTGTIYMRWMKSSEGADDVGNPAPPIRGDMILGVNGLPTGFDPDGDGDVVTGGPSQGLGNFGDHSALVGLFATAGGTQFHAREGGAYQDVDTPFAGNVVHDQWYEMWMQIDHTANQQTRYYLAKDGEAPQVVLNPTGGEWWAHRNTSYSEATAIKFLQGGFNVTTEVSVYVDTLGVDTTSWSTNSLADAVPEPTSLLMLAMGSTLGLWRRNR